jgi:hypothetical protein
LVMLHVYIGFCVLYIVVITEWPIFGRVITAVL